MRHSLSGGLLRGIGGRHSFGPRPSPAASAPQDSAVPAHRARPRSRLPPDAARWPAPPARPGEARPLLGSGGRGPHLRRVSRMAAGTNPTEPALTAVVGELAFSDQHFRAWRTEHRVAHQDFGSKRIAHPTVGEITLDRGAFRYAGAPDRQLVLCRPPRRSRRGTAGRPDLWRGPGPATLPEDRYSGAVFLPRPAGSGPRGGRARRRPSGCCGFGVVRCRVGPSRLVRLSFGGVGRGESRLVGCCAAV